MTYWLVVIFLVIDVSDYALCLHDDRKLDLIVVVDCATPNSAILGQLKTQLKYMVDSMSRKSAHFRLAIISYQNHPYGGRIRGTTSVSNIASVVNFTDDKSKMKDNINSLRCFGNSGSRRGLADALALAVQLSNNDDDDCNNDYKCRQEALTVCVLLREYACLQWEKITKTFNTSCENNVIFTLWLQLHLIKPLENWCLYNTV